MSNQFEADKFLTFETAMMRFRQGKCPCCGKGLGEPKGLEQRMRLGDLYCHTCKRRWPIEMNDTFLREQISTLNSLRAGMYSSLSPGPNTPQPDVLAPIVENTIRTSTLKKMAGRTVFAIARALRGH